MEAFAVTAQSLVGYFLGSEDVHTARRVAFYSSAWSVGTGVLLSGAMLLSTDIVIRAFVPATAVALFMPAWIIASLTQPLSAIAFVTDGIHWGTGDYTYMRNGMVIATGCAVAMLYSINTGADNAFTLVWGADGGLDTDSFHMGRDSCCAGCWQCPDWQSTG